MASSSNHPRWMAAIAALATFTALVWMGVTLRVVLLGTARETRVAQSPLTVEPQPLRAPRTDQVTEPASRPRAAAPGGIFPGDIDSRR